MNDSTTAGSANTFFFPFVPFVEQLEFSGVDGAIVNLQVLLSFFHIFEALSFLVQLSDVLKKHDMVIFIHDLALLLHDSNLVVEV